MMIQQTGVKKAAFRSFLTDSLRWSGVKTFPMSQAIGALFGMAGPIALGVLSGDLQIGVAASFGGLALSGEGAGDTFRNQAYRAIYSTVTGSIAVFAGIVIAGHHLLTMVAIPVIAAITGVLGSISRPLARAATQFIIFMIIASNIGAHEIRPLGITILFFLGSVWTATLCLILRWLFSKKPFRRRLTDPVSETLTPGYTVNQLLKRWKRSLANISGWQYPIRITSCLIAAEAFEWIWLHHHGYWVLLTVAIVVQRNSHLVMKTFQRAAGTLMGVIFASLFLIWLPSIWTVVMLIGILAFLRPMLKETNYTAYAMIMTPLVILLLALHQMPSWTVLVDRVLATLAGCALAWILGYWIWARQI